MKLQVLLSLIVVLSGWASRAVLPELTVVAEKIVHVGFAPAEYRGTFRLRVLSSGAVVRVDNKETVSVVARLTADKVQKLQAAVDRIKNNELQMPNAPGCLDAPSRTILVTKSSGQKEKIWQNLNCQEFISTSSLADSVAQAINHLDRALQGLEYLAQVKN